MTTRIPFMQEVKLNNHVKVISSERASAIINKVLKQGSFLVPPIYIEKWFGNNISGKVWQSLPVTIIQSNYIFDTIYSYIEGDFEVDGKNFNDMSVFEKRRLNETVATLYILDQEDKEEYYLYIDNPIK